MLQTRYSSAARRLGQSSRFWQTLGAQAEQACQATGSAAFSSAAPVLGTSPVILPSWQRTVEVLQIYQKLSKAQLSLLVVASAGAGYVAASPEQVRWSGLAWTLGGTFCAAACANSLNQIYEVLPDGLMNRTKRRPLPSGRLPVGHAVAFAAVTGGLGVSILATQVWQIMTVQSISLPPSSNSRSRSSTAFCMRHLLTELNPALC